MELYSMKQSLISINSIVISVVDCIDLLQNIVKNLQSSKQSMNPNMHVMNHLHSGDG